LSVRFFGARSIFDTNSYGYRPNKSAHDALKITRERCWKYDWVVEFDIKGLFDHLSHHLLMKALRRHCECKHILLYVERWLKAPLIKENGEVCVRDKGAPQGGVISPLLANLFMHYAFDAWVRREFSEIPFCRYADDGLLHCRSKNQAEYALKRLEERFRECFLELHPKKTKIIYCKDKNRKFEYENIQFDFLGHTFKPRRCVDKKGIVHPNFLPAISRDALKSISKEIRRWNLAYLNEKSIFDLSKMYNSKITGWQNYYGRYYPSALNTVWERINWYLVRWIRRKYKKLATHKIRAIKFLKNIASSNKDLFKHWSLGVF
jgi:RNA-directed DNA polymerase